MIYDNNHYEVIDGQFIIGRQSFLLQDIESVLTFEYSKGKFAPSDYNVYFKIKGKRHLVFYNVGSTNKFEKYFSFFINDLGIEHKNYNTILNII